LTSVSWVEQHVWIRHSAQADHWNHVVHRQITGIMSYSGGSQESYRTQADHRNHIVHRQITGIISYTGRSQESYRTQADHRNHRTQADHHTRADYRKHHHGNHRTQANHRNHTYLQPARPEAFALVQEIEQAALPNAFL